MYQDDFPIGPLELLIFQSTSFCNLDCKYCYLPDRSSKKKINIDIIRNTLLKLVEEKIIQDDFCIVWHAGEPTVMPIDFYKKVNELIQEIIPSNVKVTQQIQTNATLLNDEWCEFFNESKMQVGVSIDGPKEINDKNRVLRNGKGTYEEIIKGINLLKKHNIEFSVISVLTNQSINFPADIYNFFKELGPISVGFNIDEEEGVNIKSSIDENSETKLKEFWRTIFQLQLTKSNYLNIREISEFKESLLNMNLSSKSISVGQMTNPLSIITIDTEGNFSTFSPELLGMKDKHYNDFLFGNINTDSFLSIKKNKKFNLVYDDINNGIKKCYDTCDYFTFCGGGAPSNKLYENGNFNTTETKYCKYSKKIIVDALMDEIEERLSIK